MPPANERRRYNVMSSHIGRAHKQNGSWTYNQNARICIAFQVSELSFNEIGYMPVFMVEQKLKKIQHMKHRARAFL